MPAFSRVKLPRQQKTALADVLALGFSKGRLSYLAWLTVSRSFSICIVSVLHLLVPIENNRKNFTPSLKTYELFDSTSNMPTLMYWTRAKANAAITCARIMILKPLIQRFFGTVFHTTTAPLKPYHNEPDVEDETRWSGRLVERGRVRQL
ncbi:hypothetical protein GE21DRAFT_1309224 [Neurospora crassa]|nr:hypothetical protein GE21DRAFT_1309224 [Neurospora crassa]